jgi:hypothetical protein
VNASTSRRDIVAGPFTESGVLRLSSFVFSPFRFFAIVVVRHGRVSDTAFGRRYAAGLDFCSTLCEVRGDGSSIQRWFDTNVPARRRLMAVEVRWLASAATSCLHAADAQLAGRKLIDDALREALDEPVRRLGEMIDGAGLDRHRLMRHALPLAASLDVTRALADVALRKALGGERAAIVLDDFAQSFLTLRSVYQGVRGNVVDELEVRSKPLRQLWDARGRGLMAAIARATEDDLIPQEAEVVLVDPVTGGGGGAHLLYNSVRIEAVLANPLAQLPETVRLAWLLSQLNLDVPANQGALAPARATKCSALALVPATLAAAETVELARLDAPTTALAVTHWMGGTSRESGSESGDSNNATQTAETLLSWWNVYQSSRPAWPVAITALDQMLGG